MASETIRVSGLRKLRVGLKEFAPVAKEEMDAEFKEIAEIVAREARGIFEKVDLKSAKGFRARVRLNGAVVEQRYRKTTGDHPEFGTLQMKTALIPALDQHEAEITARTLRAVNRSANKVGL